MLSCFPRSFKQEHFSLFPSVSLRIEKQHMVTCGCNLISLSVGSRAMQATVAAAAAAANHHTVASQG